MVVTIAFGTVLALLQRAPESPPVRMPQWQKVDQLCGILEFAAPKKKTIKVNGQTETRLYANPVNNAEVTLYRGTALDETCCADSTPAGRTQSTDIGRLSFQVFKVAGTGYASRRTISARRYRYI